MTIEKTSFSAETDMLASAKDRILGSADWFVADPVSALKLRYWIDSRYIFSIIHDGAEIIPWFALEKNKCQPLPAMRQVIDVMRTYDSWHLAFWFDAANSYLDGRRPQNVIAIEPEKVLAAARHEMSWVCNE